MSKLKVHKSKPLVSRGEEGSRYALMEVGKLPEVHAQI